MHVNLLARLVVKLQALVIFGHELSLNHLAYIIVSINI